MTGGAGFSRDATNSSRQNRKLRVSNRENHFRTENGGAKLTGKLIFKETDIETLNEIRDRTRRNNQKELLKSGIILGVVIILLSIVALLLFS